MVYKKTVITIFSLVCSRVHFQASVDCSAVVSLTWIPFSTIL